LAARTIDAGTIVCRNAAKVHVKLISVQRSGGHAMDETGMTDADKAGLVEDVLMTWGG